tara:strand:- start:2220 stop:2351 length:132 start_codon:yes stop_codon:yes gene_type:complete
MKTLNNNKIYKIKKKNLNNKIYKIKKKNLNNNKIIIKINIFNL